MYEIVIFFKAKILSAVAFFWFVFFTTKENEQLSYLYLLFFHEQEK